MRTQSMDTHPDIERVQIEMIRKASIFKRFEIIDAWSQFIIEAAKQVIRREHPDISEQEVSLLLVERQYGAPLAARVRAELVHREKDGCKSK